MENHVEIIEFLDNELIKNNLSFYTLLQANKLLISNGLISNTGQGSRILKKILENNKIPHAYQTQNKPRQWRIPLSEKGESIKREIDQKQRERHHRELAWQERDKTHQFRTVCPNCYANLVIPQSILGQYDIQCMNCGKDFQNPYIKSRPLKTQKEYRKQPKTIETNTSLLNQMNISTTDQKKIARWLVIGTIIVVVIISLIVSGPTPDYIKSAKSKYKGESVCSFYQIEREYGSFRTVKVGSLGKNAENVWIIFTKVNMEWHTIYNTTLDCYYIQTIGKKSNAR